MHLRYVAGMKAVPAPTVRALLAGFRRLGLDADAMQAAAGIASDAIEPVDATVPIASFRARWEAAARRAPREELATEVALSIPFGAFGAIDYLAASSPTVGAAFHALAAHFRYVAEGVAIEIVEPGDAAEVRLVNAPGQDAAYSDEFTLAVFVGRFRERMKSPPFIVDEVRLSRPTPARPTRHAALLGAPVSFGNATAALRIPEMSWRAGLPGADAALLATLRELAEHVGLGGGAGEEVATQVRSRLRLLLPEGRASAADVAAALGLSERTLHRRLEKEGTSFRGVLESFREAEAERLLAAGRMPLGEVALRLGFSDQTAWNRAFRRWKGMSPTEWSERRGSR